MTKTTQIGVGRAGITAGLPLAVQVFLPRFAVEKDRLLAVALVHNNSDQKRDCSFAWQIDASLAEMPKPAPADWKLVEQNGKLVGTGHVKVAAKSSAKVSVWLNLDRLGTARVGFSATDGKESDAEVRVLPVLPLGRPAEVNVNNELAAVPLAKPTEKIVLGKFNKDGRIQLPAGFLASELDISLAASDLAQALADLDYLVDYPHGCIEQTMSRFLPVVMIKHATQHAPIALQPDITKKLPDILAKGLTRVYGYQHADGSWGWFEKDSRNFSMSVYVVYGLARCLATGTKVDEQVLRSGCNYLLQELRTNQQDPELAARAWYALALAEKADTKELETWSRDILKRSQQAAILCNLALACRTAGLNELGEQLWSKARGWQPHETESLALFLNTQL
ncbi:MAG: hypothetical protein EXR98_16695, partial [Gemmataceae bacterium]|nr:hypothetical protein [Gemmataceae bacterium]